VGLRGVAIDERGLPEERAIAVRMALVEPPDDIGLDDGEPLRGPVLKVFVQFVVIEALEEQPAGVGEVEERLPVLIDEVAAVRTDLQPHALDRRGGGPIARAPDLGGTATDEQQESRCRRDREGPMHCGPPSGCLDLWFPSYMRGRRGGDR